LSGFLQCGNSLGTTGHLLRGGEGCLGLGPAIDFRLWFSKVHFFTMFSQGAATAPRAPALYQDRGIRSMCRIARTDSHRSPVCRRQVFLISVCVQCRSFLAIARFDRDFDFVVTGVLDREQDASIRFVGEQPKEVSLLVVLLDEGQSAVSDGAGAAHDRASRSVSCRSGPA
jgi:hypothetical protein